MAAALGAVLALLLAAVARPARAPRAAPPAVPQAFRDLGVACLAMGRVSPPVDELSDPCIEAVVELLGRLMHAYGAADFGSFLALRANDLERAVETSGISIQALRDLGRELGVREHDLEGDWLAVLETYWSAYYGAGPPIVRFVPEETSVEVHDEGLLGRTTEDWQRAFDALRDRTKGPWIEHNLVVPHRRSLARVAADVGPLRWIDVDLVFESASAIPARLVARFVWDGVESEWFLQRAVTVFRYGEREVERHLIL